ncbi:hypothetical protein ACFL5A_01245 [Gemmatimonadota bacterium]
MAKDSHPVLLALARWERKGLLDGPSVQTLTEEVEEELRGESSRWSQYLLAATGGAVLMIAGGGLSGLGLAGDGIRRPVH